MSNTPSQSVLTNELKLHDYKGTKLSITFGDADINDGYSYSRINFKATDNKFNFAVDKPILNFIADGLTINDLPVWNKMQQGPNTGMNADMVDGLHAYDLKDRLGSNHYYHMFNNSTVKKFVKIATLIPRRIGTPPDFNANGTKPFDGIFSTLELQDKIAEFKGNTVPNLKEVSSNSSFASTDMLTEGIYNSSLRATVTILKNNSPTTADIHIGLFNDPTDKKTDGSNIQKMFYVSLHDSNIPYISSKVADELTGQLEKTQERLNEMNEIIEETIEVVGEEYFTTIDPTHPNKNYKKPAEFSAVKENTIAYGENLDTFRLYHTESISETIDGVKVITNKFDLYIAISEKAELHIQPYMSSNCILYNFEKPITESSLPNKNYLKGKSIYDVRYAYKDHRHLDYEKKITAIINEVDQLWDTFNYYVTTAQGKSKANRVMMTNGDGSIYAAVDNFERHTNSNRTGERVLGTNTSKAIYETSITTTELGYLDGAKSNIQTQINNLLTEINALKSTIPDHNHDDRYLKLKGTAVNSNKVKNRHIYVQRNQPAGENTGDLWITW